MSGLQSEVDARERIDLRAVVGLSADGKHLEFWCEDEAGMEYEIHGQISFTFDKNWPQDVDQVAVVALCDPRFNPFKSRGEGQ